MIAPVKLSWEMTPKESILVVDDDESLLELCAIGLSRVGYDVSQADHGETALESIKSKNFDLVLTDFHMPGKVDGYGVLKAAKTKRSDTEVIIMTAMPTLQTAISTLKEGASDFIIKPFKFDHLQVVVRRCLDARLLREELSNERQLRGELETAYKELQKVEQLKESFLARVSHEIRTPLSQVLLALQILDEAVDKEAQGNRSRQYLNLAMAGASRLDKTMTDLLGFVDLQRQPELGTIAPCDLQCMCEEVAERLKPAAASKKVSMSINFEPAAAKTIGDAVLLAQAFQHLIHNAILFNKDGGSVRVEGKLAGERIRVQVIDSGDGIPQSEFKNIFDSFYQIALYLTRKVEGLGLGLAITRRIVEAHGGEIMVQSKEGEGSVFTVLLPREPKAQRPKKA